MMNTPTSPDNANPVVHAVSSSNRRRHDARIRHLELDNDERWFQGIEEAAGISALQVTDAYEQDQDTERIDENEVFDLIRSISDPEHPLTLEQLAVVSLDQIQLNTGDRAHVLVEFTPTIPHCSMATLIGLSLRVRLLRSLPERFKVDIKVKEGSHQSENAVNKQLNDKERVAGQS